MHCVDILKNMNVTVSVNAGSFIYLLQWPLPCIELTVVKWLTVVCKLQRIKVSAKCINVNVNVISVNADSFDYLLPWSLPCKELTDPHTLRLSSGVGGDQLTSTQPVRWQEMSLSKHHDISPGPVFLRPDRPPCAFAFPVTCNIPAPSPFFKKRGCFVWPLKVLL